MKNNKLLKVCTFGLITLTLFAGCQKTEGKVSKMKKNDEISYSSDVNIVKDYYTIELYQYKDNESLLKAYKDEIDYQKGISEKVEVITNTDNVCEMKLYIKPGEAAPAAMEESYSYVLFIKNDTDYIAVYQNTKSSDKSGMIKIGKEIKNKFDGKKDYKKLFDEYAKENNLNVTDNIFDNEALALDGCVYAINGTNSYTITYSGSTAKVSQVKKEKFLLNDTEDKVFAVGKSDDGKTVWTLDLGTEDRVVNDEEWLYIKVTTDNVYLGYNGIIECRNLQTGKLKWTSEMQIGWAVDNLIETEKTIFVFTGEGKETITLINAKNGKPIYDYLDVSRYLKSEKIADDYYDIVPESAKLEGDILTVKVTDDGNDSSVIEAGKEYKVETMGYLKINIKDYSVKFEKAK